MARLTLLVALVVALAGCGGSAEGDSAGTEAPTTSTQAEPTTTEPEPETTTGPETTTEQETTTEAAPRALPGLPRFTAGYTEWAKLATDLPPRDSDPHLGTKDVFTSKQRRGDRFPAGTVIVKDARRPGADFIGLVATMRKVSGADPSHNNWIFVEWTRESAGEPFTETASGQVCWSCHMGAEQADYVWVLSDSF